MGNSKSHLRPKHLSPSNQRRSVNAILENVFTILPTFALIFAFVNFGLLLFRLATRNAVQGQDASVEAAVRQDAMGMVPLTPRYLVPHKASFQSSVVVLPNSQCHKELAKYNLTGLPGSKYLLYAETMRSFPPFGRAFEEENPPVDRPGGTTSGSKANRHSGRYSLLRALHLPSPEQSGSGTNG
jgi:hypothetical protein